MKAIISVLMSVYNESLPELQEAVTSVLSQTFEQFEFIIVCDAPQRMDLFPYLDELKESNQCVTVLYNETNVGLAMSMNRAAQIAKGEYYVRMDADDVCRKRRLELQYDHMVKAHSELSCTWFSYIDEHGNPLDIIPKRTSSAQVRKDLPYYNTIHHPTVMIKKEAFWKVGGYRDFPCAQDYDLWLRLYDAGVSMTVLEEELLYYRIRTEGISQKNKFKQLETIWYVQKLFRERRHGGGQDSYSKQNYEQWLRRHHIYDRAYIEKAAVDKLLKDEIDNYRGKPEYRIQRSILMLRLFAVSPFYRRYFMMLIKNKICRKLQLT